MERLKAGQDTALNDLMERHSERLYHFLLRMLNNEEDANDLAQETFVRVYTRKSTFNPSNNFKSWLYTIAANLARNHHRWRSRHPQVSIDTPPDSNEDASSSNLGEKLPSTSLSPSETVLIDEKNAAVRHAVQQLPEDMREAILLCEWDDLSMLQAATVLNTTSKAIESRLYRARKLLRDSLAKWL